MTVNECVCVCVSSLSWVPCPAPLLDVSWTLSCRTIHLFIHSPKQGSTHRQLTSIFAYSLFNILFHCGWSQDAKTVPVLLIREPCCWPTLNTDRFHPPAPDPGSSPLLLSSLSATSNLFSMSGPLPSLHKKKIVRQEINLCYLKWRVVRKNWCFLKNAWRKKMLWFYLKYLYNSERKCIRQS